jgi:uncharacterized membrane protein
VAGVISKHTTNLTKVYMNKTFLTAALTGLLATGFAGVADAAEKEKCYGVAKAGKNGCGTASHSCAGHATKDNDPNEWVLADKATCEKEGGKPHAPEAAH